MALKTGDDYLRSMKSLDLKAHMLGRSTSDLDRHGLVTPSRRAVAYTFDAAHDPETRDLFCVESSLCKDVINRFSHLHQGTEALVNKVTECSAFAVPVPPAAFSAAWAWMRPETQNPIPFTVQ